MFQFRFRRTDFLLDFGNEVVFVSRTQSKTLQLPGSSSPPYDNMTEESAFDDPVYETGVSMDDMYLRDVGSHNTIVLS